MQQRYCEDGLRLDTNYFERTRVWVSAEADKRVAIGVSQGVGVSEWNEIARRADDAKLLHEQALREYMEHVIACPVCNAHLLVTSNAYLSNHLH
jgi:2-phosphoglycerate kinase